MIVNLRKHKLLNNPFLGLILLALWGEFFIQYTQIFSSFAVASLGQTIGSTTSEIILSISTVINAFVCLLIHKLWFQNQYKGSFCSNNIFSVLSYVIISSVFFCALNIASISDFGNPIVAFILALAPGISEEVVFRALPLSNAMRNIKNKYFILVYLIISSAIFGGVHFINYFSGAGFIVTCSQVIYATGIGFLLGALFIRSGSIIPGMILHTLIDFSALLDSSLIDSSGMLSEVSLDLSLIFSTLLLCVVPIVIGNICLRPSTWNGILDLWKNKWNQN